VHSFLSFSSRHRQDEESALLPPLLGGVRPRQASVDHVQLPFLGPLSSFYLFFSSFISSTEQANKERVRNRGRSELSPFSSSYFPLTSGSAVAGPGLETAPAAHAFSSFFAFFFVAGGVKKHHLSPLFAALLPAVMAVK